MKNLILALFVLIQVLLICSLARAEAAQEETKLEQVIQQALRNDLRILKAEQEVATARLELEATREDLFVPQISLSVTPFSPLDAQGLPINNSGRVALAAGLTLPTGTTLSLGYSGTLNYTEKQFQGSLGGELAQTLFKDLSLNSINLDLKQKQATLKAAEYTLAETKKQGILDAVDGFLNLVLLQESIAVTRNQVELARDRLKATQSKVEQGQESQVDLLNGKIALHQSELDLAKLEDSYSLNQEKFLRSIGWDRSFIPRPFRPDYAKLLKETETLLALQGIAPQVIQNTEAVRSAENAVDIANEHLKKMKQDAVPGITFRVNFDGNRGWGLRLDLNYDFLGSYGRKIHEAENTLRIARRALESAKESAKFAIYAQKDLLKDALRQKKLFDMKRELAILEQEMAQKQSDSGLLSKEDWQEFLIQKRRFENDYQRTMYNLIIACLEYQKSLGMDLTIEEVAIHEEKP